MKDNSITMKKLRENFQSNDPARFIYPLLWLRGEDNETEDVIRNEIRIMYEAGSAGFVVESRPHKDYLGNGWWRDLGICVDEAKKSGMKIWIFDEEYYPSGIAGGRVLQKNPDQYRMRVLVHHSDLVGAGQRYRVKEPGNNDGTITVKPDDVSDWEEILSIWAYPINGEGQIVFDGGFALEKATPFNPPSGSPYRKWKIEYVGITPSWSGRFYEKMVDYVNPEVTDEFIHITYEQTKRHFGHEFGKTIMGFFGDETGFENYGSYDYLFGSDVSCLPWTRYMFEEFSIRKKYDLRDRLYLLWNDYDGREAAVRFDFMDVMTQLLSENFFRRCKVWCDTNGIQFIGHIVEDNQAHTHHGYGTGHFFRSTKHFAMGGYDLVLRQLVPGYKKEILKSLTWDTGMFAWTIGKLAHSVAHLDIGTDKVLCENYGAYGWTLGLRDMKWLTDWQTVRGTNVHIPHAFSLQFPDEDCPPHFYAKGNNPQWPFFRYWVNFVNRSALMLENAVHQANVLVLYPAESHWAGDPLQLDSVCRTLSEGQIDFDIISMDLLLDEGKCRIENGSVYIEKESFSAIIIPPIDFIPKDILKRLNTMSSSGLTVIFIDTSPSKDVHGDHDTVREINAVFLNKSNVHVLGLLSLVRYLQSQNIASIKPEKQDPHLRYYQILKDGCPVFFLFNESLEKEIEGWITFYGCGNKIPEIWNPLNGTVEQAMVYRGNGDDLEIFLRLRPYESIFIVFQDPQDVEVMPNLDNFTGINIKPTNWLSRNQREIILNGIDPAHYISLDGPEYCRVSSPFLIPETTEPLIDTIKIGDWSMQKGFENFSGTVSYTFHVEISPSDRLDRCALLDPGEVWEIARLIVNGTEVGIRICPPYMFILSGYLKIGHNEITIEVTNTLGNRLEDPFQPHGHKPSGLLGPVRIYPVNQKVIDFNVYSKSQLS